MKRLSASIVFSAGLATLVFGGWMRSDTGVFIVAVGCLISTIGIFGWFKVLGEK